LWALPFVVFTHKLRTTVWNHYMKSIMTEIWDSDFSYLELKNSSFIEMDGQHASRDSLFFFYCCRLAAISLEVTCMQLCMKIPLWNTSCYYPHVLKALSPSLLLLATTLWMWVLQLVCGLLQSLTCGFCILKQAVIKLMLTHFRFSACY
jgi:hypothetical protein